MENDDVPAQNQAKAPASGGLPAVNKIKISDITSALQNGAQDFIQAPLYGFFFGGIMALGGMAILLILTSFEQRWWILPIAFGFPLIGPFAAVGLYDVSRRLENNIALTWGGVLGAVFAQRKRQIPSMGFVVLFIFWVWMYQVRTLVALFAGLNPFSTVGDFKTFLSTTDGVLFLGVGTGVGAVMALALFTVTVIAIPMLLDREIDFMTAMITSVKTVFTSPVVMLGWGIVITALALLGIATGFLGLFLIFPILGHATWHLYRRAVAA